MRLQIVIGVPVVDWVSPYIRADATATKGDDDGDEQCVNAVYGRRLNTLQHAARVEIRSTASDAGAPSIVLSVTHVSGRRLCFDTLTAEHAISPGSATVHACWGEWCTDGVITTVLPKCPRQRSVASSTPRRHRACNRAFAFYRQR